MINKSDHYVAWAELMQELEDAHEHLNTLSQKLIEAGFYDEIDLATDLGHIYAHLNRFWHARNQITEISAEQWSAFSQFPDDLKPIG